MLAVRREQGAHKGRPYYQRDRLEAQPRKGAEAVGGDSLGPARQSSRPMWPVELRGREAYIHSCMFSEMVRCSSRLVGREQSLPGGGAVRCCEVQEVKCLEERRPELAVVYCWVDVIPQPEAGAAVLPGAASLPVRIGHCASAVVLYSAVLQYST